MGLKIYNVVLIFSIILTPITFAQFSDGFNNVLNFDSTDANSLTFFTSTGNVKMELVNSRKNYRIISNPDFQINK